MSSRSGALSSAATTIRILIPAGKATPTPPLGPALGQRGVKAMDFCKQFNDRTKNVLPEAPIPTLINVRSDRSFSFVIKNPPTTWFLKRAAGVEKGASKPGSEIVGKVTLKHVYEIAKVKKQQTNMQHLSLRGVVKCVVATAKSAGIEVVN
ncbi:12448_t:CDS:1 [Ambispora gerdemannii]|uniref:Large ribosomal subunit protein uL11m n=1 Tax=Ambispora gerdemannii TaxID=144530 RepID=A0A9N9D4R3_9GLOM|nr:12448_t:CDS:1 [Ambispora gerdemannii]